MRQRRVRIAALSAVVVLGAMVAFLATRPVAQEATSVPSALIGTAAPTVTTTDLAGQRVVLAGAQGHVVVLSFFASWCGPCATEAPQLATFWYHVHQTHASTKLYGVVFNDSDGAAAAFGRTYGLTYPVLTDPSGVIANAFTVDGPPVTVVITPRGRIAAVLEGPVTSAQLTQVTAAAQGTA